MTEYIFSVVASILSIAAAVVFILAPRKAVLTKAGIRKQNDLSKNIGGIRLSDVHATGNGGDGVSINSSGDFK